MANGLMIVIAGGGGGGVEDGLQKRARAIIYNIIMRVCIYIYLYLYITEKRKEKRIYKQHY